MRRLLLVAVVMLLIGLTWTGVMGWLKQLPQSTSPGERIQTWFQLVYGAFALLSVVTTFVGRRWRPTVAVGWAISVAIAGGLASVVWGGTSVLVGVLSGGASLLVAVGITWLLRVGARGLRHA